jgi:tetratricopeptide (TPR) repeat protein
MRALRWYDAGARLTARLAGRPASYRAVLPDPATAQPVLSTGHQAGLWLDAERTNLIAAVRLGLDGPSLLPDLSADIVIGLYPSLLMRCHGQEFELVSMAVLSAGPGQVSEPSLALVGTNLGQLYRIQGRLDEALDRLNRALANHRDIGDDHGVGRTLEIIAQVHVSRGDPRSAIPIFEQALQLRRAVGDLVGEGATLSNLAEAHHRIGRGDVALRLLERSLSIRRQGNDPVGESITNENIAEVYLGQGQPARARRHADEAIECARRCDARDVERRALTLRARICLAIGDRVGARADCETALAAVAVSRPTNVADLHELASAFRAAADNAAADLIGAQLANMSHA